MNDTSIPPKNKAALLERIRTDYALLDETISQLSDEQLTAPIAADGWSIKDILAHIAAWDYAMLASHIGGQPFHEAIGMDAARAEAADLEQVNEHLYRRGKELALNEAQAAFRRTYQQLMAKLEQISEAELYSAKTPSGGPLIDQANGIYEHYEEHLATIRGFVGRSQGRDG
jgi:uncharacterized protein (TIGR03083 family)